MQSQAPTPRARLLQILESKDDDGFRSTVPVFGSGLNCQAKIPDSWDDLMMRIRSKTGMRPIGQEPISQTAKWETYLRHLSRRNDILPSKAERMLQKHVASILNRRHAKIEEKAVFRSVLQMGFRDVISLNFDLSLEMSGETFKKESGAKRKQKTSSLFRRNLVYLDKSSSPTTIWHPHGDSANYRTIRLGTRMYGLYINQLENMRSRFMRFKKLLFDQFDNGRDIGIAQTRSFVQLLDDPTWVDVFFHSPIIFLGTSLSSDEWPLWWALHERARYLNRKNISMPTVIAIVPNPKKDQAHLYGLPANLEVLEFSTHEEIWETFFLQGSLVT